jgi:hypothetical protein
VPCTDQNSTTLTPSLRAEYIGKYFWRWPVNKRLLGVTAIFAVWAGSFPALCIIPQSGRSAENLPQMSAVQVVAAMQLHNKERERALESYEGHRHYKLEYKGFPSGKSAEMEVSVRFDAPGKKQFVIESKKGSGLLINKVLKKLLEAEEEATEEAARMQTALSPANYTFELERMEVVDGRNQYVMKVEPLRKDKLLYRGRIWVDSEEFAVTRIEAEPARNPSFWIKKTQITHHYAKVGSFWLPASNQSESSTRLGGHAQLDISYTNYVINPGTRIAGKPSVF